jgi:hypothetical protein
MSPARKIAASLFAAATLSVFLTTPAHAATDAELAFHWAPVHYQDTDSSDYDADYLSTVDFDGEWDTVDNWEAQDDSLARLTGAAYYSVVDSATTFASWGTFRGDNGKNNAAHSAWGWDDANDGTDVPRGLLATDPAYVVSVYFANLGTFSLTYTRNTYR